MTAGTIVDEGRHLLRCWACTYRWQDRLHLWRTRWALLAYEAAVEAIEAVPPGRTFSVSEIVRGNMYGRSPTTWRATALAVHDMALHGLIECVERGSPQRGRQGNCYRWRVIA